MTQLSKIRVGIIGLNPERGWARDAHVPALRSLQDQYEITAACTSRKDSARTAAQDLGIPYAFVDPHEMAMHPQVDLVVVAVKVPEHDKLVRAGLDAGKHVYCEWPLAMDAQQADALAQLADAKGVRHIMGLQSRASPVIRRVHDLVADGYIGRLRSSSVIASGMVWGPYIDRPNAYILDARNRVTMETVPFGHFIDAFCHCLGPFTELSVVKHRFYEQAMLMDTGEMLPKTAHDQLAVHGQLENGAVASIHYRGGISRGANFYWEINGDEGDLVITSDMGQMQLAELKLRGARGQEALESLQVDAAVPGVPKGYPWNVGHLYAALAPSLCGSATTAPNWTTDFHDAVKLHRFLKRVDQAAIERRRLSVAGASGSAESTNPS